MNITIITVGSKSRSEVNSIIQDFYKRLPRHIRVTVHYIKHANGDPQSSIQRESESILSALPKKNKLILLDETGKQYSSPALSKELFSSGKDTTLIIGGAYGVNKELRGAVDIVWSLGALVYPHQIVRLILSEQIYRAHCINVGHPYHHA